MQYTFSGNAFFLSLCFCSFFSSVAPIHKSSIPFFGLWRYFFGLFLTETKATVKHSVVPKICLLESISNWETMQNSRIESYYDFFFQFLWLHERNFLCCSFIIGFAFLCWFSLWRTNYVDQPKCMQKSRENDNLFLGWHRQVQQKGHIKCTKNPEMDNSAHRLLHTWWWNRSNHEGQETFCVEEILG